MLLNLLTNNMFKGQIELIEEFNEKIHATQKKAIFTRNIEIQKSECELLRLWQEDLEKTKIEYIAESREEESNFILLLICSIETIKQELCMLIQLKQGNMANAWDALITAQNLTQTVARNHPVDGSYLSGYSERLHHYETILFPEMVFSSIGGIVEESECSICKGPYGECDHIKGYFYMGQVCSNIISRMNLKEVSIVENPANKHCRMMYVTDKNGDKIDLLTLSKV